METGVPCPRSSRLLMHPGLQELGAGGGPSWLQQKEPHAAQMGTCPADARSPLKAPGGWGALPSRGPQPHWPSPPLAWLHPLQLSAGWNTRPAAEPQWAPAEQGQSILTGLSHATLPIKWQQEGTRVKQLL